jgi:hypothetical protein
MKSHLLRGKVRVVIFSRQSRSFTIENDDGLYPKQSEQGLGNGVRVRVRVRVRVIGIITVRVRF